eukprot:6640741-Alexandrium_andersonii.AAC.1
MASSTRAELVAALHAVLEPRPIHIMTDSKALCHGFERAQRAIRGQRGSCLANVPDSDLWQAFVA